MRGRVASDGRQAVVPLRIEGGSGVSHDIEAIIDTGFTSHLTLPPEVIQSLSLPLLGFVDVDLADGSLASLDVYEANVLWHGKPLRIPAYESPETLLGMELLAGSRLTVDAEPGGPVAITPL